MSARIMCENLIDPTSLITQTYSSKQTSFPDTNIQTKIRRSKVWRSNGYWEITSANNKIVFRETVGVDLTATVAVANYTSTTTFLAAIKTAMQAVGASTYTVSQDTTTNKIKIVSNGSGGGGVFQLRLTDANFTIATTIGFSTASVLTGALTYTADTLKINTSEWIRWDLGISTSPKAFILVGVRNSNIKISPTATITLQGNGTDVWTSPSFSQALTYNANSIVYMNSAGFGAYRYWRLLITDVSNSNAYIEISSVYLGTYYQPTRGGVSFPLRSSMLDRSETVFSEGGQPFSDNREKGQEFTLDWNGCQLADIEKFETYWRSLGMSYPWFVVLDPDYVFSSSTSIYTRMCRWSENLKWELVSPDNFQATMNLREEL